MFAPKSKLRRSSAAFRARRGFTLIEVLVVIAITAIISSYAIIYGKIAQNQTTLYINAEKIGEAVLRAKALALATYDNPSPKQSCGYGVALNYGTSVYSIFSYEPPGAPGSCSPIGTINALYVNPIDNFSLDRGVSFAAGANNFYYILFVPPNPQVLISDTFAGTIGSAPGNIYLKANGGALTVRVSITGTVNF